jgi:Uma2 family endonuclease
MSYKKKCLNTIIRHRQNIMRQKEHQKKSIIIPRAGIGYVSSKNASQQYSIEPITSIGSYLKGKDCKILYRDMRMSMTAGGEYMYPDALIVCGERQLEDDKFDTLLNPSVIFEILPPCARSNDKGRKFFFYQEISFLQEYIN